MVLTSPPPSRDIELRGAPANLFALIRRKEEDPEAYLPDEILLDGPAGTGKTMGCGFLADYLARKYPGSKQLFLRQVRRTLADSVLETWEDRVLGPGHPAMHGTATARNRSDYVYPNGSKVVLGGMDNPEKLFSTEWDVVWFFECIEAHKDAWEKLSRSLRWAGMPFQLLIGDTNPGAPAHFINKRFPSGIRDLERADETRPPFLRLLSKHGDNPYCDTGEGQEYLRRLSQLTGSRRSRLYLGEWVGEEGQIFEEWDPQVHLVDEVDLPEMSWYFASGDFGYRAPGVLQVWGVECPEKGNVAKDRIFLVAEVYRTEWSLDQWAGVLEELHKEFSLKRVVFDSAEPRSIQHFNDHLGKAGGRSGVRLVVEADKAFRTGLDAVHHAMARDEDGIPRLRIMRNALRYGRDPKRIEADEAVCTLDEIPAYVWRSFDDGQTVKEEPQPGCSDHGLDAMRYACMWKWKKSLEDRGKKPKPEWGTAAWLWDQEKKRNRRKGA